MDDAHAVVAAYWAAAEARDWATFAGLLAEDVVYEGPQTRERVRGRDAYLRFNAEGFPGGWHLHVQRIARIIDFWPTRYELPASRAHLVERY
jgi:ketosteroid isomerase-like protein